MEKLVTEELAIIQAADDTPPRSLTDHRYSGKFVVRVSPSLRPSVSLADLYEGSSPNRHLGGIADLETWYHRRYHISRSHLTRPRGTGVTNSLRRGQRCRRSCGIKKL